MRWAKTNAPRGIRISISEIGILVSLSHQKSLKAFLAISHPPREHPSCVDYSFRGAASFQGLKHFELVPRTKLLHLGIPRQVDLHFFLLLR